MEYPERYWDDILFFFDRFPAELELYRAFSEQMERSGYSEDVLDAVYNLFDGFNSLDFLELDDLVNGRF